MLVWERSTQRGVSFTAREYDARLRMHARRGSVELMRSCTSELLAIHPEPDPDTISALRDAFGEYHSTFAMRQAEGSEDSHCEGAPASAAVVTTTVGVDGRCQCCGQRLPLLSLSSKERQHVREVIEQPSRARRHAAPAPAPVLAP